MSIRDYVFTSWTQPKYDESKLKYICWGRERCPTTDREHYQGFAIFSKTNRIPAAKRILGGGDDAHLEPRRGTRSQAREYCRKDGEFFEWGKFDDITKEELFAKSKKWLLENGYEQFYCRFHRAINERQDKGEAWREVEVTYIWGEPGTGKTRKIMEMEDVYKWDSPYQWFDGYDGEKILLIDDYETGEIPPRVLKNILDGYRYKLNIKGGHTYAKWSKIYLTSNYDIKKLPEWHIKGIQRRIHNIVTM